MYNRDKLRKLLSKTTTAPSPASSAEPVSNLTNPSGDPSGDPSASISSLPSVLRPTNAQNAVYAAGAPIACLDVAADRRIVVLGGPHTLKTVVPEDPTSFNFTFKEGVDLRAHITALPSLGARALGGPSSASTSSSSSSAADQLNIRDVKVQSDGTIFTACANGKIFAYDVRRLSAGDSDALEYVQIHEDSRQVNALDLSPHRESWLLSGSQDGMVRMFDTAARSRNARTGVVSFRQRYTPLRCNEPVRQVAWSPRSGYELACCTDAGVVLKWDIRTPSRPLLKINAHEKACSTIAWHPDGIHLASGGADLKLHVWDLGPAADKRQKPKHTVSTPAPLATARWRPGLWSASAQSRRAAQVAVTYDDTGPRKYGNPVVHLWDLARPTMPYKEIERFDAAPTALSWQNQDILWTVGKDGMFHQCDMAYAPNVVDRQSVSTMAFSPRGDVVAFLDERPSRRPSRPRFSQHRSTETTTTTTTTTTPITTRYGSSPRTPMLSLSKSDSEEDVIGTFLGPRRRERHHSRRASARSAQSMSTTPPSAPLPADMAKQLMDLEQSIQSSGQYRLQQAMASGPLPAAKGPDIYGYLSSTYLETIRRDLPVPDETTTTPGKDLAERVLGMMEQFARAAELASLFRLSQTWRVLAFAMDLLLRQRAQYHLQWRLARLQALKDQAGLPLERRAPLGSYRYRSSLGDAEATPRQGHGYLQTFGEEQPAGRTLAPGDADGTSNAATPRARPADQTEAVDIADHAYHHAKRLSPILEPESLTLGPAATGPFARESPRRRLDSAPLSLMSQDSEPSTEGYDFYDADALAHVAELPQPSQSRRDTSPGPAQAARSESPEEVFMLSQTTNGSAELDDVDASQSSHRSRADSDSDPMSLTHRNSQSPVESMPKPGPEAGRPPPWVSDSPEMIDTDYLPWPGDPDYPFPQVAKGPKPPPQPSPPPPLASQKLNPKSPLDPCTLVQRALEFECKTSALNASAIILLLKPLVPAGVIDDHHASAVLRQHHTRLTRMSLFVEAALLRQLCVGGWPAGLPDWGGSYEPVFAPAQKDVYVRFVCARCRRPKEEEARTHGDSLWVCGSCRDVMAPCAVCGHRDPQLAAALPGDGAGAAQDEDEEAWLLGWWHCPSCSHGGHASCLRIWHSAAGDEGDGDGDGDAYSGGCCPLDGCGHACLPGSYRGEATTARADELARAALPRSSLEETMAGAGSVPGTNPTTPVHSRPGSGRNSPRLSGRVMSDVHEALQSRAVGTARETLSKGGGAPASSAAAAAAAAAAGGGGGGGGGGAPGSGTGGILSSSPGRAVGERERRKSVKFAKTDRS